jgi:hypothetical protein
MKNRKREICTSGTVRDEDGNILIYSAITEPAPISADGATIARRAALFAVDRSFCQGVGAKAG